MNKRSHLTQRLQNYFDVEDVRVRELPYSLDAQILNAAAQSMEVHQLRYQREVDGRLLSSCPLGIDNQGIYYRVQLPNDFVLPVDGTGQALPPSMVTGYRHNFIYELKAFDDICFTPGGLDYDTSRAPVALSSPLLGTIDGVDVGSLSPGVLPFPNRISFWTQDWGPQTQAVRVIITGEAWPRGLWPGAGRKSSESFIVTREGLSRSRNIWYSVDSILVYGLTEGASIKVYAIEMNLPAVPDPLRPYMLWNDRERQLDRYWSVTGTSLRESYYENSSRSFPDLPLIRSINCAVPVVDLAFEPFTFGAVALQAPPGSTPTLLYFDRREPLPEQLAVSALTAEPNYGLVVSLSDDGAVLPKAVIETQPYGNAGSELAHRFTIADPTGAEYIYFESPSLGWVLRPYDPYFWVPGAPASGFDFPLTKTGTYVFKLETRDKAGAVLYDATPFLNQALDLSAVFELDVPDAQGIGYDYAQRLWVWDGSFLQPFVMRYEAYVFDAASRCLYLTNTYDSVQVTS